MINEIFAFAWFQMTHRLSVGDGANQARKADKKMSKSESIPGIKKRYGRIVASRTCHTSPPPSTPHSNVDWLLALRHFGCHMWPSNFEMGGRGEGRAVS